MQHKQFHAVQISSPFTRSRVTVATEVRSSSAPPISPRPPNSAYTLSVESEASVNEIIVHGIVVGAFQENCWVIGNRRTGDAICVDPGDQPDEIIAMAKDMGVSIRYIANSHAHIDHVLGVRGVIEATGAKFLLHASDLELLRNTASSARRWTGTEIANPPDPDGFLADQDDIDVDGVKIR